MKSVDIAVVGGGPAGAATACGLAASGHDVMVLERSSGPHHKVCGEFLSIETQAHLGRLGIDLCALGAVPIRQVSVHTGVRARVVTLPFSALSLSRFRLDEALLQRAAELGATVERGISVQTVESLKMGFQLQRSDGEVIRCQKLVLATGKLGLRGIADTRDGSMVGLKMHLEFSAKNKLALAGCVELFLFNGGYAGLELVEDGIANLCLILPRAVVAGLHSGWPALRDSLAYTASSLAERLEGATPLWEKPIAVVCPAGGYLRRSPRIEDTVYYVGDRLAHIPPFTGDGLAIALSSAALAVEHIRRGESPMAYLADVRRLTTSAIRLASIVSKVATNRVGQMLLLSVATHMSLLQMIARRTRLPLPAGMGSVGGPH